jgi:phage protein D
LLQPSYKTRIGRLSLEPDTSDDMTIINVKLSMDAGAPSHFEGVLRRRKDQDLGYAKGDSVAISLGYKDDGGGNSDLTAVFNGEIDSIKAQDSTIKVTALSPFIKLCNLRTDRFYEQQSAGAIVKDLADSADVSIDTVSEGIQFPSYAISSNKSAFDQIMELANLCGFDFYSTNKAKLIFKKHEAKKSHALEYGKNIIKIYKVDPSPPVGAIKVFGSSPSSSRGSETWHWLTKKNIQGSSSSGGNNLNQLSIQYKAIRDEDTAKKVAEATLDRLRFFTIVVQVVGNAKVMLGDTAKIQGVSEHEDLNGEFQIRGIEHYLSKSHGFTTTVTCKGNIS